MDNKFLIETSDEKNMNNYNIENNNYYFQHTNDHIVNDFLNQNISLEKIIENEIFKVNL